VHRYSGREETYEVEFVTGEGDTVAVLTLGRDEVRPMDQREILHARELAA
jgi:putative heme iron utilization protein